MTTMEKNMDEALAEKIHEEFRLNGLKSDAIADELIGYVVKKIDEDEESTLTDYVMGMIKSLTELVKYYYKDEEEYTSCVNEAISIARDCIIPAILDPVPCGECENCQNGSEVLCTQPNVRAHMTSTKNLLSIMTSTMMYNFLFKFYQAKMDEINSEKNEDAADAETV